MTCQTRHVGVRMTAALCIWLALTAAVSASCSNMQKITIGGTNLVDFTRDEREFPLQTRVNAPITTDNGKDLDHFGSCAAHCVSHSVSKLVSFLGQFDAYISVNEQEKLQYACEGMCRNELSLDKFIISVRTS